MQTANLQELLASIYLSSNERRQYFTFPEESAKAYGLTVDTLRQISETRKETIDFYAKSLKRKRLQEIAQFIPITMRYWKESLRTAFEAYSENCIPSGPKKHIADLISFANYAVNNLPAQAKDCLMFELVPWRMNFKLMEKEFIYKSSQTRVTIVEARRREGMNFKTTSYQLNPNRFMHALDSSYSKKSSRIRNLGVYLKLPYISKVLEWYLPYIQMA